MIKKCLLAAAQLLVMTLLAAGAAWLYLSSRTLYRLSYLIVLPVCGLFTAYFITRKGVNNYLAWILPPVGMALGHLALYGELPNGAGGCLICALTSIIGAAAGEVKNRWEESECPKAKNR